MKKVSAMLSAVCPPNVIQKINLFSHLGHVNGC